MSTSDGNELQGHIYGLMNANNYFPLTDKNEAFTTKGSTMLPSGATQGGQAKTGKIVRHYNNAAMTVDGQGTRTNFFSDPGDTHYFKAWMYSQQLGQNQDYFITISYIVQFWDLINMTPS